MFTFCLSLAVLSSVNLIPKDCWLVVLRGYFDGGNQADSRRYDRISLATACGTCEQWAVLEREWRAVLNKHGAPFLHTTDAVGLRKEFSKDKGWNDAKVDGFISDCVKVIDNHLAVPGRIIIPGSPYPNIAKQGLNVFTMTIPLDDYKKARKVNSKLPNDVNELCTTESLGVCFKWGRRIGAQSYELFFDQGEPFFGHAYNRKHNKQAKKAISPMKHVVNLGKSDMRLVPALQIADLFAWCINHINKVVRNWHQELHRIPQWDSLILDYPHLLNPTPGALERIATWNLPKRKPNK